MAETKPLDIIGLGAARGMLDEAAARAALGTAALTVEKLVELGVLEASRAEELRQAYREAVTQTLRLDQAAERRCDQCGRRLRVEADVLICDVCGTRSPREGRRVELRPDSGVWTLPVDVAAVAQDPKSRYGHFIRVRKLGHGGTGTVWLAWDTRLTRRVALKILAGEEPEQIAAFKREARTAAAISHANIAAVYEVGELEEQHYIAMQYIEGETLARLRLTPREAIEAVRDVARAVAYAHAHGVVHRDLKPHNVMRRSDGQIFVLDFGLARLTLAPSASATGPDAILGTPAYMSPEQATGNRADERSDVYGLGATLYELMTAQPPFVAPSALEILRQVIEREPIPPRRLNPRLDRDIETCILKAMDKDPARRYESAAALADDLDRLKAGEAILAHPASLTYRIRKRIRRNPIGWIGGTTAAVMIATAAVSEAGLVATTAMVGAALGLGLLWALARQRGRLHEARGQALLIYHEARSWYHGAVTRLLQGEKPESKFIQKFEMLLAEARRTDPTFDGGWFERAQYWRLMGDEARAWEFLNEGLARRPDDPMGKLEKGMLMAARYRRELAVTRAKLIMDESRAAGQERRPPRPISTLELEQRAPQLRELRAEALELIHTGASAQAEQPWVKLMLAQLEDLQKREE
jgi:serine/threonine-protein kinase